MPLSRSGRFLLAGTLIAGAGGAATQLTASAAVALTPAAPAPAIVLPTSPAVGAPGGGWNTVRLPISAGAAGATHVAAAANGHLLIDWTVPATAEGKTWRSALAIVSPTGKPLTPLSLGARASVVPWSIATAPTVDAKGRGLVLGTSSVNTADTGLGWATVSAKGKVGTFTRLTKESLAPSQPASLAENARGDAVAAWVQYSGGSAQVKAALRPAGKGFGKAFTLLGKLDSDASGIAAAIDPSGRVGVAYGARLLGRKAAERRIFLSTGTVKGKTLSKPIVAGPQESNALIDASYAKGGRLDLVWGSQAGGEEAGSNWIVRATSLGKNAHAIEDVQLLDDGEKERPNGAPQIVPGPGSSSIVAWDLSGPKDAHPVRYATSNPFGQYGSAHTAADDGTRGGLAARGDGTAVVTLSPTIGAGDESTLTIDSAVRAPGSGFLDPTTVAAVKESDDWYVQPLGARPPAPAMTTARAGDPAHAVAAWVEAGTPTPTLVVATRSFG